ncbi:hypothetical protein CLAIMM_06728 [Cladophialophora immunda]|nr:hypothetical protein CLAIMM_06728 [Cladophialophora immunda]
MAGPFHCRECDKAFTAKSTLNGHLASAHRGERSVCEACQKVFTDKSNLRRHRRSCSGNAGLYRCAWHEFGCDHTSNRVDNVKRHIRSCPHKPLAWADELPGPVRVNQEGLVQNDGVLDNRTPQVNGLQSAAPENAQEEQFAPAQEQDFGGYGVHPPMEHWQQQMLQEEALALVQGPAVTLDMGVDASQQGINLAPGVPTDPVWFAANYTQFNGHWGQEIPRLQPPAKPISPATKMTAGGSQQATVPKENAVQPSPFTTYGSGGGVFLTKAPALDSVFAEFF